jgi:TPR repeat protein
MLYCLVCGAELSEDAEVCPSCKAEAVNNSGSIDELYEKVLDYINAGLHEKGIPLLRVLAEREEYPYAQCALAICYANGRGVEQSGAKAEEWYRKAAEQGDEGAIFCLSSPMFESGKSVTRLSDNPDAIERIRQMAEQGDMGAIQAYDILKRMG